MFAQASLNLFVYAEVGLYLLGKCVDKKANKDQATLRAVKESLHGEAEDRRGRDCQGEAETREEEGRRSRRCMCRRQDYPVATPEGVWTQDQVRELVPPWTFVWRELQRGGWAIRSAPYPGHSASWRLYGHQGAFVRVLQYAWRLYLDDHGMDACPIEGAHGGEGRDAGG